MEWRGTELPGRSFEVVYADFPWSYYGQQTKWGAAAKFYRTAPDEDILAFPMADLLEKRGVLLLWATSPRLGFAYKCIERWGLHEKGVAFNWVKTKKDGVTPIGAQGVRPSVVKSTSEYVIAASRTARGRPLPLADESVRQVVLAPKGRHSEKPEEVRRRIERLYPDASKIELFARVRAPGWEAWGDEVPGASEPATPGDAP